MCRLLFIVEDSFLLKGRGLILVPGIKLEPEDKFKIGDPLLFKRPDGTERVWKIGGIEMISYAEPRKDRPFVFSLKALIKDDVPIGTQVWSIEPSKVG